MLVNSQNGEKTKCIFKCKNFKHCFRLPNHATLRKIWLRNLGLESNYADIRVCNNHFSKNSITKSGSRLMKTAVPDQNIPLTNGVIEFQSTESCDSSNSSKKFENLIDHILDEKETYHPKDINDEKNSLHLSTLKEQHVISANDKLPVGGKNSKRKNDCTFPSTVESALNVGRKNTKSNKIRNSISNLQFQSKFGDATEIPQFILVFTVFKANGTEIVPPKNFSPNYEPSDVTTKSAKEKCLTNGETSYESKINRTGQPRTGIKYVLCEPKQNALQREREVQVNIESGVSFNEVAVQCDLEEEWESKKHKDNSQLEWIDNIVTGHTLNADAQMYECHICGEIAASYASNINHSLMHEQNSLLCFQCGILFKSYSKLKKHEEKAHLEDICLMKKALRCPQVHCKKAFHSKRQLFDHIDRHTTKIEHKCGKCHRVFFSFLQLHCHKMRKNCWR